MKLSGGKEEIIGGVKEGNWIMPAITLSPPANSVILLETPGGGGGYGDPLERDPERVINDVLDGYVSLESAEKDYGVIIDTKTWQIDWEATEKLRKELKKKRKNLAHS